GSVMTAPSEGGVASLAFGAELPAQKAEASIRAAMPGQAAYLELEGIHAIGDRGTPAVSGASLSVRPGEIVGVAGVSGNGQKELLEILAGQRQAQGGRGRVGRRAVGGTRGDL